MTLRTAHGAGKAAGVRVEVLPVDELPAGVPEPARPPATRDAAGRFVSSDGTREVARKGGKARGEALALGRLLGLTELEEGHAFTPYARLAREWRDGHMARLAALVGGGEVGAGPASILSSAALQLASSRWLSDRGAATGDAKMLIEASRLANDSRQNLLAAHELVAKEAMAKPRPSSTKLATILGGK